MIDKKKILIGIVGAVIAAIAIITIIIIIPKGKKYEKTVFIGPNNRLIIDEKKMSGYFDEVKVKKQDVKVYYEDKIIDGYVVTEKDDAEGYKHALTVYSTDGELLDVDKLIFAYTSDLKPSIKGVYFEYIDSLSEVMRLVVNSKLDIDITTIKMDYCLGSAFDLDDDNEPEYIYSMGLYSGNNDYTGAVIMEKNKKLYIIDVVYGTEEDLPSLSLLTITDFNNDGNYEFVIQDDASVYEYTFFNFDGTTFNQLNLY